ncbi:MAG: M15 family metallopeptidase [Clostridia bacterium]|nr:M15 family metallopeptidase [Clostridia bacterium]
MKKLCRILLPAVLICLLIMLACSRSKPGNEPESTETQMEPETVSEIETTAARTSPNGVELLPERTLVDPEGDLLVLVNRFYCVREDYVPELERAVAGYEEYLQPEAARAYSSMYFDARSSGVELYPCSGYRSYEHQKKNYEEKIAEYAEQGYTREECEALAANSIMPPGSSEHTLGLAMDIGWVSADFENGAAYEWLCAHAWEYGFILRYPSDKADITGVKYEPWHWRYVGVDNAFAISRSGLCLEEFLSSADG